MRIRKRWLILVLFFIGLGMALYPRLFSSSAEPVIVYDTACHITNIESTVLVEVEEGGSTYLLVDSVNSAGEYYESIIIRDNAGCTQQTGIFDPLDRPGEGLPQPVAFAFAKARWQLALDLKGKPWVETHLATSDIGGILNSIDIYSEDIAAFAALKIKIPPYLKGLDEFETDAEARAYYTQVFQTHPLADCQPAATNPHC